MHEPGHAHLRRGLGALSLDASARLAEENCAVAACLGRILASDIVSTAALPPFDNSAMDGFALRGDTDVVPTNTELDIEGEQAAGDGIFPFAR